MNVTLSRFKRGVVVVGHEATLQLDTQVWGPWLPWVWQQTFPSRQQSRKHAVQGTSLEKYKCWVAARQ